MVRWDKNATKATNVVVSKDRLMVVSYCNFIIFLVSTALTICVIFVVTIAHLATISLLLLLSNPPSQTLKHTYP
jgi:hypothetical protein